MQILNNISKTLGDDLRQTIRKGGKLSVVD